MYKALIVDDEPLVREYLTLNLSSIHNKWCVSACVPDGYKAVEILKEETFDAVITDICMPGMDGLELAKHISDNYEYTFTVILSGYNEFDYARQAVRFDVVDYLLKPIRDEEIHDVLERLTGLIEKRRSAAPAISGMPKSLSPKNVSQQFRDYLMAVGNTAEESVTLSDRASDYIYAHFCEPIGLTDVAGGLGVSPAYLSNVFHTVKGESYSKFLLRLRMDRASLLLDTCPHIKIYAIAKEVGYASVKHFISVFKKYYGFTPNEYREKAHPQGPCNPV